MAPQPCFVFSFLSIVFRFSISSCIFVIQINFASHFRLRNISLFRVYVFHPLYLLFALASSAVSFLVAVVIMF